MTDLLQQRKKFDRLLTRYQYQKQTVKDEKKSLIEAQSHLENILTAQKIVQEAAEAIQASAHSQVASLVSRCLETVFGEDAYKFQINFLQKRGKTEAELVLVRNGKEIDPIEAAGGGICDIVAFALRLTCLVLSRPRKRKILILDEPFRFVSQQYRPAVRELLLSLARDFKIQMLIVTHNQEFRIGKVVEVE